MTDIKLNFNSIKVRLEPSALYNVVFVCEFQFHKGAIRTESVTRMFKNVSEFQFHKGAIRTQYGDESAAPFSNFNSIKVRLEQRMSISLSRVLIISIP